MKPQRLYSKKKDDTFKEQDIWFCSECNKMSIPYGHLSSSSKERAEACCKPKLCACGKELNDKYSNIICEDCQNKSYAKSEWKKREKASVIKVKDYGFDSVITTGGSYISIDTCYDMDLDDLENHGYFYCVKKEYWSGPDWDAMLEDYMADNYSDEDGCDTVNLEGLEELTLAQVAFEKQNASRYQYTEDPIKVILAQEFIDIIKEQEAKREQDKGVAVRS